MGRGLWVNARRWRLERTCDLNLSKVRTMGKLHVHSILLQLLSLSFCALQLLYNLCKSSQFCRWTMPQFSPARIANLDATFTHLPSA